MKLNWLMLINLYSTEMTNSNKCTVIKYSHHQQNKLGLLAVDVELQTPSVDQGPPHFDSLNFRLTQLPPTPHQDDVNPKIYSKPFNVQC